MDPGQDRGESPRAGRPTNGKNIRSSAGATVYELAARFGIHRVTVSAHLHSRGVTLRHQGLDDEGVVEAIRLYEGGWSLARIGDRLGVDATTVWTVLKTQGMALRDTHGRER